MNGFARLRYSGAILTDLHTGVAHRTSGMLSLEENKDVFIWLYDSFG